MLSSNNDPNLGSQTPKLRTACENCRQSKVKCNLSSKNACIRCLRHGLQCRYGIANRSGKPKGSKNRATLRREAQVERQSSSRWDSDGVAFAVEYANPRSFDESELEMDHYRISDSPESLDISHGYEDSGYMPGSMSPTFLQKEFITKGETSCSLAVHIPYPTQHPTCACIPAQLFHMNQLNHMATDVTTLHLDHSLQAIKTTLNVCQTFLHCPSCQKDNTNMFLSVSALDAGLHLLGRWITSNYHDDRVYVHYGEYEMSHEESRHVRQFLLRGLLLSYRETLVMVRAAVECVGGDTLHRTVLNCEGMVETFLGYV